MPIEPVRKNKVYKLPLSVRFSSSTEKDYLIENLAMLTGSGMAILSAFDAVQVEFRSRGLTSVVNQIKNYIENGLPLWQALDNVKIFSAPLISLVKLGEKSGRLSENLKVAVAQREKEKSFRSKVITALLYPSLILSMTIIVGLGVAWFILPRLASMFSGMNVKLPTITKILVSTGNFLGQYGYIVVPLILFLLILLAYFAFVYCKTKFIGQLLLLYFPGTGKMIREVELSRFGYTLGNLLGAGLPILDALDSLIVSTTNDIYKKIYLHFRNSVEMGNSFRQCFSTYKKAGKLIPMPVQQLIIAGEQSGQLPEILIKIGQTFEARSDNTTKNVSTMLEPMLLVVVAIGVMALALAVILPIYSLIGSFNQVG